MQAVKTFSCSDDMTFVAENGEACTEFLCAKMQMEQNMEWNLGYLQDIGDHFT